MPDVIPQSTLYSSKELFPDDMQYVDHPDGRRTVDMQPFPVDVSYLGHSAARLTAGTTIGYFKTHEQRLVDSVIPIPEALLNDQKSLIYLVLEMKANPHVSSAEDLLYHFNTMLGETGPSPKSPSSPLLGREDPVPGTQWRINPKRCLIKFGNDYLPPGMKVEDPDLPLASNPVVDLNAEDLPEGLFDSPPESRYQPHDTTNEDRMDYLKSMDPISDEDLLKKFNFDHISSKALQARLKEYLVKGRNSDVF
ncbi:hypothetical protein HDU67_002677 [Dinochytrium kinnereticum]|nr:hypothetical protein HDU67_002677 [Dinochytrium kinnereticum]